MNKTRRTNWTGTDNLDIQDDLNVLNPGDLFSQFLWSSLEPIISLRSNTLSQNTNQQRFKK